jgi:hypothetical protein
MAVGGRRGIKDSGARAKMPSKARLSVRVVLCSEREKGSPMADDLVARIQHELEERMAELRGAVEERDRLQAELSALDPAGGPAVERVLCFPARREMVGRRLVSAKVARLLLAPRRPAFERSGARVNGRAA